MSAGVQGNASDLQGGAAHFNGLSESVLSGANGLVSAIAGTGAWQGSAAAAASTAVSATRAHLSTVSNSLAAGSTAMAVYSTRIAEAKAGWDRAHAEDVQLTTERTSDERKQASLRSEMTAIQAQLSTAIAANAAAEAAHAAAAFAASLITAVGPHMVVPPLHLIPTAPLQAKIQTLESQIATIQAHVQVLTQQISARQVWMNEYTTRSQLASQRLAADLRAAQAGLVALNVGTFLYPSTAASPNGTPVSIPATGWHRQDWGGPIQTSPQISVVFLGPNWTNPALRPVVSSLLTFYGRLKGSPYNAMLAQYRGAGTGTPILSGAYIHPAPGNINNDPIVGIRRIISGAHIPVTSHTQVVAVLPPGRPNYPVNSSGQPSGGYHSTIGNATFTVLGSPTNNPAIYTVAASHEYAETLTDPRNNGVSTANVGFGFTRGTGAPGEVGDVCEGYPVVRTNGISVQTLYNAGTKSCTAPPL